MANEPRADNSKSRKHDTNGRRENESTKRGANGAHLKEKTDTANVAASKPAPTDDTNSNFEIGTDDGADKSATKAKPGKQSKPQASTGKNIIIFSDGTGQEGGVGNNTNVYSLFNMVLDRSREQISFYDQGLGTGDNWLWGAIVGAGIGDNVADAYQFLSDNFKAGDQIYLFGFSRGATTVRSLSAFIHLFGILPQSRPELFYRAWDIYRIKNKGKRARKAKEFVNKNHTMWTKIRMLGVWDTVAALSLPLKPLDVVRSWFPWFRYDFHDLKMSESVEYGRHAVAIDDLRRTFHPVLFEERGAGSGELFSSADVSDLNLAAKTLLDQENPVSKKLLNRLESNTLSLLKKFPKLEGRQVSREEKDILLNALVANFNTIIQSNKIICDLSDPACKTQSTSLNLSAATRESLENISSASSYKDINRLNRLLIEDVYSLKPRIKQVWFTGMHSDVGGGYDESGLAHIPLLWMVSEAVDLGLKIYSGHKVNLRPDVTAKMNDSRSGLGYFYRRRERSWNPQRHQGRPPLVHKSVKDREQTPDFQYKPWVTKTGCEVEPWPVRLQRSIQYNDERIWRRPLWGWGSAFEEKWSDIERISLNESASAITLHMKETGRIHVQGSLPHNLLPFVNRLERIREHHRLQAVDGLFAGVQKKLAEKVKELESTSKTLQDYIIKDQGWAKTTGEKLETLESTSKTLQDSINQEHGRVKETEKKLDKLERTSEIHQKYIDQDEGRQSKPRRN